MKRWPVAIWLAALACCVWIVMAHTRFSTDMAAFLPDSAAPAQQLMVEQLRNGAPSRMLLLALQGAEAEQLAVNSKKLARALEASGHFAYVRNGEQALTPAERERLMQYRYLLSPATDPAHFSADGLRQSLQDSLQLLASPAGVMVRALLPSDPTGEMLALLESWGGAGSGPGLQGGVWFSADGKRALLLAETKAPAFDIDAQQKVSDEVRRIFPATRSSPQVELLMSGPGIFAVESRNRIRDDAWRLSMIATALVAAILLLAYGSPRLLVLGMLPVASGALAGLTAVSLGYGTVHGITLGFGATLIGEAVDYPTYLFTQRATHESLRQTLRRIWPTLRLAVLTTVFGSFAMLLSGFSGLSQLGMFSFAGVLTAGLMTRFVIPEIAPSRLEVAERTATRALLVHGAAALTRLGWVPVAVLLCAAFYLAARGNTLWENDLANLSPVSQRAKELDQGLRNELGAPDVRYLIAVQGSTQQAALERSERLMPALQTLVRQGITDGFDLAARVIPSEKTQAARQAALPDQETLRRNLQAALATTPFKPDIFEPFLQDIERSRHLPLLQPEVWYGTPLGSLAQGMLVRRGAVWVALIGLRGVRSDAGLAAFVAGLHDENTFLLDIKGESNKMIMQFRDQSLLYSLFGVAAIVAVLGLGLRNFRAVFPVMLPVSAAILGTAALLSLLGVKLTLFHVVSLLLVLGVGLNYGLFLSLPASLSPDALPDGERGKERQRALFSTLVCMASTVSAFGALAFSASPVLQAIGGTVALGAVLSLLFAAMRAKP
ncbi:MAG: MMPL family transporter [Sulfuricella sp.]|nr:MMPL family transporter [Sulfuricella sp.]